MGTGSLAPAHVPNHPQSGLPVWKEWPETLPCVMKLLSWEQGRNRWGGKSFWSSSSWDYNTGWGDKIFEVALTTALCSCAITLFAATQVMIDLFSIRKRCSIPLLRSFQQAVLPCHQDGVHAPHCGMQGFFHPLSTAHLSNCLTCYDCSWSSNTLMLKKNTLIIFSPFP